MLYYIGRGDIGKGRQAAGSRSYRRLIRITLRLNSSPLSLSELLVGLTLRRPHFLSFIPQPLPYHFGNFVADPANCSH